MSKINEIITKAIVEEDFRKEFLTDPVKVAEGFALTMKEKAELRAIELTEIQSLNVELEERLSKSFVNLPVMDNEAGVHCSGSGCNHQTHPHSSNHSHTSHKNAW